MAEYSGRTTSYIHKFDNWQDFPAPTEDCIQRMTIFDVQWSNCPVEVEQEVKRLWQNYECGNDKYIVKWDTIDHSEDYPIIDEYLKGRGVEKCWIHYWW